MDRSEPGRQIYASSNGDCWHLLRDPETGRSFVRHAANLASGGQVSDIGLTAFLGSGRNGPEHQELWRLIGTLIDDDRATPTPTALG
jgi:hypothetical protein